MAMVHSSIQIIRDEHTALAAIFRSLREMVERGPGKAPESVLEPENYFDVLRAMLFYIDEFPERVHHPKESDLLFPRVARMAPETLETIVRLERDHASSEADVRKLQHLLLAWELLGESRRAIFEQAVKSYLDSYLKHMLLEETVILPAAIRVLNDADWEELDAAFATNCDPLTGKYPRDPAYEEMFKRIVMRSPALIGEGEGQTVR